jgi:hypothetical protein
MEAACNSIQIGLLSSYRSSETDQETANGIEGCPNATRYIKIPNNVDI